MALQTLDTVHGVEIMAALLRKPHWNDLDQRLISSMLSPEPWPHLVHYARGRFIYTKPDEFCTLSPIGSSDCEWMVPGTGQHRR